MAEMGFFAHRNPSYQMTLPYLLTSEKVKAAIFRYAKTEDEEFMLHPEYLVTPMPFSEATTLQHRLSTLISPAGPELTTRVSIFHDREN
jgi:hypothetical protein